MIKTKWILSCLVAMGTMLTASAQAQTYSGVVNTFLASSGGNQPVASYNVTLNRVGTNFAINVVQNAGPADPVNAFVNQLSFTFVNAANVAQTVAFASPTSGLATSGNVPEFAYQITGPPGTSVNFQNVGGASGIGAFPASADVNGNTATNDFFTPAVVVPSLALTGVRVSLQGNASSGIQFIPFGTMTPESNSSILLLAALLPIGILVARRRSAKSSV